MNLVSFRFSILFVFLKTALIISCYKIHIPDLPNHHYQYWLRNNPGALRNFRSICNKSINSSTSDVLSDDPKIRSDFEELHANLTFENPNYRTNLYYRRQVLDAICTKIDDVEKSCWGYENKCEIIHLMPECADPDPKWAKDVAEQKINWFQSADFGYIGERRKELERYCSPNVRDIKSDIYSSLECSKSFKMCRGKNLYINFRNLPDSIKNDGTFLTTGDVGGWNCDLQRKRIKLEGQYRKSLQSWFNELGGYELLDDSSSCDIRIDKPAYIMKLDATTNMYHHFCDFLNLYSTIHLNNSFSMDNQIVIWDTKPYKSNFGASWLAFSKNPIMDLSQFKGKRVCFKDFVFPLLPRLVDGIYYNTPLITGCTKSGLFDAFNKHLLHKLKIPQHFDEKTYSDTNNELIRVRILIRSKNQRKILNIEQLVQSLRNSNKLIDVKLYNFDDGKFNFTSQLEIIQNTDILVGMHGAGLTHTLFLPDWASVIELYNCGDADCYKDLSRLRGVFYYTWRDQTKLTKHIVEDKEELDRLKRNKVDKHEKFLNYSFNKDEFVALVEGAIEGIKSRRIRFFENKLKDATDSKDVKSSKAGDAQTKDKNISASEMKSSDKESNKAKSDPRQQGVKSIEPREEL